MSTPNLAVRFYPEPLRTLAFGSISGTYAGIGSPFLNPIRLMHVLNNTDALLTFSFDGINDHFVVASMSFILLDVTTNRTDTGGALAISQGQRIYVKGSPSENSVYLAVFFGSNANI
jgi:hypothetical protein